MPVTNYYTVNGALIGEKTTGGTRTDYLTDALGNVTATVNQSGQVVNTYRYKPYGAQLAKTGVGVDPAFQWVGNQGYRQTGKKYSDVYVRARHYDSRGGKWTTKDPLSDIVLRVSSRKSWMPIRKSRLSSVESRPSWISLIVAATSGREYRYSNSSPTLRTDFSGLQIVGCASEGPGGVFPSMKVCPGGEVGCTDCNPFSGLMWSLNCDPACTAGCTALHERQHRIDMMGCCWQGVYHCQPANNPQDCALAWFLYRELNRPWSECNAYRAEMPCEHNLIEFACPLYPSDPAQRACCIAANQYYWLANSKVNRFCPGATYWPCPVDSHGNMNWKEIWQMFARVMGSNGPL